MSEERVLIVNADDFGLSPGINRGIIEAHERGILTSASLMVRWPAAAGAAAYARARGELSVGLHLDLGEMIYADDEWRTLYEVLPADADEQMIHAEVARQFARFHEVVGRAPTHVDSHQHCHRDEPVRGIVLRHCAELGIPLRECTPGIRYCGAFYGQSSRGDSHEECIGVDALLRTLETMPAGITELGCHPAATADFQSTYREERLVELATLCDPRVRAAVVEHGLRLLAFHEIPPDTLCIAPPRASAPP